ncbi:MAG: DUF2306 domain-containing protein [Acidobacteriaceae bacterium]|nr:DUF2306 domain-containing protein [Acidobacteriaceae bacterium]
MHNNAAVSSLNPNHKRLPLWLRIGFWICTPIAVAVVIRRIFVLAASPRSSAAPQLAVLDNFFASHAPLTLAHIIPALAFVLVAPFVVLRGRAWAERLIYPLGAVVGVTAYAMSSHAIGGWTERSAVLFFNTLFLISLFRAFLYRRKGDPQRSRVWLLRAIAILLGIATTRPVMGLFFATSPLTHLAPQQFFGIAFWIGFSINTLVFELWIRSRSRTWEVIPLPPVNDDDQDHSRVQLRRT